MGSGALTLRRAVLIATVCEFSGAVTLGRGVCCLGIACQLTLCSAVMSAALQVSDTIVRQISNLDGAYCWNCSSTGSAGAMLFMLGRQLTAIVGNSTRYP